MDSLGYRFEQARCEQNPRNQWIVYEDDSLRIVPQELWDRVKARQLAQSERIGKRVRQELSKTSAKSMGRSPRYLLSTVLKCAACGSNYTIRGRSHYACGRHLDGRACSQKTGVKRSVVEPALLEGIKRELLSDEAVQAAIQAAHKVLNAHAEAPDNRERIEQLQVEIENLTDAIAAGGLRGSHSLATRLAKAEQELEQLESARPAPKGCADDPPDRRRIPGLDRRARERPLACWAR